MEPYVEIAVAWSTWTDVACLGSGEAIGLLFGEIRSKRSAGAARRIITSEARANAKMILGRYGKIKRLPSVLWNFMITEAKLIVNRPEADAEVMLFLVESGQRRKGIGRMLMDRFVEKAKRADSKRISVYADDLASNWRFYENYGFRRAGEFHDNWSSYYNMERAIGIRFVLDLDGGRQG